MIFEVGDFVQSSEYYSKGMSGIVVDTTLASKRTGTVIGVDFGVEFDGSWELDIKLPKNTGRYIMPFQLKLLVKGGTVIDVGDLEDDL